MWFRTQRRVFRLFAALFSSLLVISVLSMVDLYFEANLPGVRTGMRRGYFFLMAVNVGLFNLCLAQLYAAIFARRHFARWGWLFLVLVGAAITVDMLYYPDAALPPVVLAFLKIAALVIGGAIAFVALTPRYHIRRLTDDSLRRYVSLSFVLFALLLSLYLIKQVAGDRDDFFTVFGRVHFGVFFAIANLLTLYYALKYLAKPAPGKPDLTIGEIRLTQKFNDSFSLTPREVVIVTEIIAGKSNREIARAVDVTEGTVKIFVHNIYKKTGVNNRMALAALVRQAQAD